MEYLFLISSTTQGYPDHISLKIFLIFILEGIMSKYLVLGWHICRFVCGLCKVDFNGGLSVNQDVEVQMFPFVLVFIGTLANVIDSILFIEL